jgi:hypothetical protein
MSKAEEKAMQCCCTKCANNKLNCGMKLLSHGRDCIKCSNYIKGYEQAEKDLELTWEDIPKIFQISEELKTSWWFRDNEQTKKIGTQIFWEEVLKRFKEQRT